MALFCIEGETASGKDSLIRRLKQEYPDLFDIVVSYTDRPMRETEVDGREHYFVSKNRFTEVMETEDILAYTHIRKDESSEGYRYCASAEELKRGKNLYIIDPKGVKDLKERFPELDIFVVYISCPARERLRRAISNRKQSVHDVLDRMERESEQFKECRDNHEYDAIIFNNDGYGEESYQKFKTLLLERV
jgi:guanylate kinase